MPIVAPHAEEHGAFQNEVVLILRNREPVQEAFEGILRDHQLEIVASFAREIEQPLPHRRRHILDLLHAMLSTYGRMTFVTRQM